MKKRKTYEISIIDKTYSKTISDETKFYTSDTALELVFKLKETEYTFESAEIVLLNIDDRSLVTRPVSEVNNDFVYELDDDIIPHYGEWHGQLRLEAGEIYVSSPVKFRIENDLSNDRPPQLSDVQSWVSLKRYADSLTEELKQAVLSVEGIEDTFNANETIRQSLFETDEQSRQTTFETNESERDETFEINETTRQAQELEREKAESQRQTTFDDNEANRNEMFNANEATRQENETTRQQAETQRATAESSRASAEAQRKIDHANRSAELDGKADKVVLNNLVSNGDFSKGSLGWQEHNGCTIEVIDSRLKVDVSTNNYSGTRQNINVMYNSGDIIYTNVNVDNPNDYNISLNFQYVNKTNLVKISPTFNGAISVVDTAKTSSSIIFYFITKQISGDEYSFFIDNVILLNLTNIFGAGNEPTKEEMDELIKITGYISSEYALDSKELLMWTISLMRNNRKAIIALGGTI